MTKKKGNIRRLYAYAIPYLPWFGLAFLLILISTMTSLIQPVLVQRSFSMRMRLDPWSPESRTIPRP